LQATEHAPTQTAPRPVKPAVPRPKPSDRASQQERLEKTRERLVAAWLRSLSPR
jgi:hypothetical protein